MGDKKSGRAPRGTGTVFFCKRRGKWVARKPIGGGRYLERTGKTQAEAIANRDRAAPPDPKALTVGEWAARWLDGLDHKPLTLDSYRTNVTRYIAPTLGRTPITKLTPHGVEAAARQWGRAVGANTVRLILAHLSACLGAAVRDRLIPANPVDAAKKPRATRTDIDPFTPAEVVALVGACGPGEAVFALLAATGVRRGEAVALDVSDYDRDARTISVTRTSTGRHGFGPPKSPHSVRTIRVPAVAVPAVERAAGSRTSGALFVGAAGPRVSAGAIARGFAALLDRLGLRRRNLHQLRHSFASNAIAAGAPIADVAAYIGDSVGTVVRTYLHPGDFDVVAAMDRLFAGAG